MSRNKPKEAGTDFFLGLAFEVTDVKHPYHGQRVLCVSPLHGDSVILRFVDGTHGHASIGEIKLIESADDPIERFRRVAEVANPVVLDRRLDDLEEEFLGGEE